MSIYSCVTVGQLIFFICFTPLNPPPKLLVENWPRITNCFEWEEWSVWWISLWRHTDIIGQLEIKQMPWQQSTSQPVSEPTFAFSAIIFFAPEPPLSTLQVLSGPRTMRLYLASQQTVPKLNLSEKSLHTNADTHRGNVRQWLPTQLVTWRISQKKGHHDTKFI